MRRARAGLLAAVTVVALSFGLSRPWEGDEGESAAPADGAFQQPLLDVERGEACRVLTKRLARDYLGASAREVHREETPGTNACTYWTRDAKRGVTVGLYPASEYDKLVEAMPRTERVTLAGRRAAYNERLGYLVELPDRPYYLQATFQHVVHQHADRRMSRRLAATVVADAPAPTGKFICTLPRARRT